MKAAKQRLIILVCFVVLKSLRCFFVNENAFVACFDSGVDEAFVKELAGIEPLRVAIIFPTRLYIGVLKRVWIIWKRYTSHW